jgi:hypothetical protein
MHLINSKPTVREFITPIITCCPHVHSLTNQHSCNYTYPPAGRPADLLLPCPFHLSFLPPPGKNCFCPFEEKKKGTCLDVGRRKRKKELVLAFEAKLSHTRARWHKELWCLLVQRRLTHKGRSAEASPVVAAEWTSISSSMFPVQKMIRID